MNECRPKKLTLANTVQLIEEIYSNRHAQEKKKGNEFNKNSNDLMNYIRDYYTTKFNNINKFVQNLLDFL